MVEKPNVGLVPGKTKNLPTTNLKLKYVRRSEQTPNCFLSDLNEKSVPLEVLHVNQFASDTESRRDKEEKRSTKVQAECFRGYLGSI